MTPGEWAKRIVDAWQAWADTEAMDRNNLIARIADAINAAVLEETTTLQDALGDTKILLFYLRDVDEPDAETRDMIDATIRSIDKALGTEVPQ